MLHTFGPSPALFAEADPNISNPTAVPLRLAGVSIAVRNAATQADLPPVTTAPGGYITYGTDDIPSIQIASKKWNGTSYDSAWVTQYSNEVEAGLYVASDNSQQALLIASQANDKADQALASAGSSGISSINTTITPDGAGNVTLNSGDLDARSKFDKVPATDVSGLATVATTGAYGSLTGTPLSPLLASDKGKANGVASLGADGKLSSGQIPSGMGGGSGTPGGGMTVVRYAGTAYGPRPTADTSVAFIFAGPVQPTVIGSGTNGMIDGIDFWFKVPV